MNSLSNINIDNHKLLTENETKRLISLSQQGDRRAKDELIKHNLRLVMKIAHRFKNSGYSIEDIFQIGSIGLIKAIDGFDLSKGVKFSTYAVPLIIGEIKVFLRDDNIVKVSRSVKETAYRIKKIKEELEQQLNREPTIKELSEQLGLSAEEIVSALEAVQAPKSIHEQVYQKEGSSLELADQLVDDEDHYNDKLNLLALNHVLKKLDKRSQLIIKLRYFEEKSQGEIAKVLGLSQAQVSRLEKKILKLIRSEL
ncbi:RNA polymerase, sigma subunit, RpoX/SigF [Orenia metallireducens]|jgi:RNA polymerase sporulation-specific sigma factor|uniref:RNA polymerase sigma factor n=1 Tax=Orenia metallireducens TaxID=1413210 RepID=A0A285HKN4_9FIRM|nr:SigF/SigG family RNA polymerase sporulation sigma factor [Orenia metallireducens]SNY36298.1 RNA polymerase, sigma subunit, RpoX/SigF [Orenia metallireducens]